MQIERIASALTAYGTAWVLWLLLGLSVLSLAVILERGIMLWLSRDDVDKLGRELDADLGRGEREVALRRLEASPSFEARIARAALDAQGPNEAEERMVAMSQVVRLNLEQRLSVLGTLGNNAPFIGLLGTVIGVVRAFRALEGGAGQVSAGLMSEIGEALVATAVGLLVALPAVVAFNALTRIIRARVGRGEALSRLVLAHLKATV
ncbi:MAG: MotA/TolQ/ExbB proton channel family protein [Polyangiaceae bacterium]